MAKKHNIQGILEVGDKLFRKQGYHNTGTDEILKEANYPRSSFYYHFGNKEGFGIKTLEFYSASLLEYMDQVFHNESIKSPTERLKKYFFSIIEYNKQNNYSTCCLIQRFSTEADISQEALLNTSYEGFSEWLEKTAKVVKEGQDKGEIIKDFSEYDIATYLFSTIYGAYTLTRLNQNSKKFKAMMEMAFIMIRK